VGWLPRAGPSHSGHVTVCTRNGNDWTARFGPIANAVELLPARTASLDGEVVALDRKGVADFHGLRRQLGQVDGRIIYKAFDLLWLDGKDMRPLARERAQAPPAGADREAADRRGKRGRICRAAAPGRCDRLCERLPSA
jgi:hypothetical protein